MALFAPSPYGSLYDEIEGGGVDSGPGPSTNSNQATLAPSPYESLYAERDVDRKTNPYLLSPLANAYYDEQKKDLPDGRTYGYEPPPNIEQEQPKGIPMPDPKEDPGGAIIVGALNRGAGMGNGTGLVEMPQPPSMEEVQIKALEEEGKQVLFDQNKIPKPMESMAFNMGLMSFGLNLLSGNDYATAFNQAGAHFQQAYGREKREIWAQDLIDQGYDAQDIQRWIETGDNKDLTDPMEKKMRMQQYRLGQQQLENAMYENSPQMRAYKRGMENYNMQMEAAKFQSQQNFQNENLKISQTQANIANEHLKLAQQKELRLAATAGATADGKFSAEKEKALNHYTRAQSGMKNYDATMAQLGDKGNKVHEQAGSWIPGVGMAKRLANAKMVEMALSGDPLQVQMAREWDNDATTAILAEKEWLSPVMRKDSGAAVSHNEWNNMGNIYFPRPGDSAEKIAQKQQAREIVTMSMNPNASPQLKQAVDAFSSGQIKDLRLINGQAYVGVGGKMIPIPMTQF
ncbi:MAG: hypothetical protein ACRDCE_15105 [Cetobacterium sp.]|uniref:hypothetical protein n=1 Tax=Cetobacterium sp. TaxID=2071632 RepID=UPI003EE51CA0